MLSLFLDLTRIGFPTRPQAFQLAGRAVMTLPEDRIYDDAEQVVLSTTHLQSLLDEFVFGQPTRRKIKVKQWSGPSISRFESSWFYTGGVTFLSQLMCRGTLGNVSYAFVYTARRCGHTLVGGGYSLYPPRSLGSGWLYVCAVKGRCMLR